MVLAAYCAETGSIQKLAPLPIGIDEEMLRCFDAYNKRGAVEIFQILL